MSVKRTKHFKVSADEILPPFRIQEEDYQILLHVLRRRLITSKQLRLLYPHRSAQKITRRLRVLMRHELIDKPPKQSQMPREGGGSFPHTVAVSDKGAKELTLEHPALDIASSTRTRDNLKIEPRSIREILDTTQFMTLLELSRRKHDNISMKDSFDLLQEGPETQRRKSQSKSFTTQVQWQGQTSIRGIEPDEIVVLHYKDKPIGKNKASFFVEIDRGTETVEPQDSILKTNRFFRQSYVMLKWIIYASALKARSPLPFGFTIFRVLMVTTTPTHMKYMQVKERKWLGSSLFKLAAGFVLFSNQKLIEKYKDDLLKMPWEDGNRKQWYLDGR